MSQCRFDRESHGCPCAVSSPNGRVQTTLQPTPPASPLPRGRDGPLPYLLLLPLVTPEESSGVAACAAAGSLIALGSGVPGVGVALQVLLLLGSEQDAEGTLRGAGWEGVGASGLGEKDKLPLRKTVTGMWSVILEQPCLVPGGDPTYGGITS